MSQVVGRRESNAAIEVVTSLRIPAMHHWVVKAQGTIPDTRVGRKTRADLIHLIGSTLPHPGAIRIFIDTGFVRNFQMIEAIIRMRLAMVTVGVRQKMQLADVCRMIPILAKNLRQRQEVVAAPGRPYA